MRRQVDSTHSDGESVSMPWWRHVIELLRIETVMFTAQRTSNADLVHKSHNAPIPYPTMHHFVSEMCTCVHISVTKLCIVGYWSNVLWDLWDGSVQYLAWSASHSVPHLHKSSAQGPAPQGPSRCSPFTPPDPRVAIWDWWGLWNALPQVGVISDRLISDTDLAPGHHVPDDLATDVHWHLISQPARMGTKT